MAAAARRCRSRRSRALLTKRTNSSRVIGRYQPPRTGSDALETAVAGRSFIAGDAFSAADVYVGSQIGWGLLFGTIPERPAFTAYWQGLAARPARARADAREAALA